MYFSCVYNVYFKDSVNRCIDVYKFTVQWLRYLHYMLDVHIIENVVGDKISK